MTAIEKERKVIEFLRENPNPRISEVHGFVYNNSVDRDEYLEMMKRVNNFLDSKYSMEYEKEYEETGLIPIPTHPTRKLKTRPMIHLNLI